MVQDEPTEQDKIIDVSGVTFAMDPDFSSRFAGYLPLEVDYDEHHWSPVRIRPARFTQRADCC